MIEVAIVGGGPAGAYCAYNLAENGIYPLIFDHSHPREKPCGGMISPIAHEIFPFFRKLPVDHIKTEKVYLMLPSGREISVSFKRNKVICVSRLEFDQYLLDMALDNGAELTKEKVIDVEKNGNMWKIRTNKNVYLARKLIGADGVNSTVRRKVTTPLKNTNKNICYGYFVENLENENVTLNFLPNKEGYIWTIPRKRNTSIGIGCTKITHSNELKKELENFVKKHYPRIKIISRWTALIPNIKDVKSLYNTVAGPNWILVGDASGHVNPISGQGIIYALLGGELAAQAIVEDNPLLFEKLWRQVYGLSLLLGVKLRKWIYKTPLLECYWRIRKIYSIISY